MRDNLGDDEKEQFRKDDKKGKMGKHYSRWRKQYL